MSRDIAYLIHKSRKTKLEYFSLKILFVLFEIRNCKFGVNLEKKKKTLDAAVNSQKFYYRSFY